MLNSSSRSSLKGFFRLAVVGDLLFVFDTMCNPLKTLRMFCVTALVGFHANQ